MHKTTSRSPEAEAKIKSAKDELKEKERWNWSERRGSRGERKKTERVAVKRKTSKKETKTEERRRQRAEEAKEESGRCAVTK